MTLFISHALIHFFALLSPSPDFFFVTQSAIHPSRSHAMVAVLGISAEYLGLGDVCPEWFALVVYLFSG